MRERGGAGGPDLPVVILICIYDIYMSAAVACTPPLRFLLKGSIYMYTHHHIYIILDADFDEDSDSDLRLEIGAHLDLVFEG